MNVQSNRKLPFLLVFLALFWAMDGPGGRAFAQRMPEATHGPSVASQAPLLAKPGDYAGWQTCAGCHRAEAQAFAKTAHAPAGEGLPISPPAPTTALSPSAAAGKKLYDEMMCAGCHTIGGQGGEGGGALDNVGVRRTRAELLERMTKRRPGVVMPTLPPICPMKKSTTWWSTC